MHQYVGEKISIMSLIKEVLCLNLERRKDRKYAMLGHLTTSSVNVPQGIIRFFRANDGAAYESSEAVIEAAVADGFDQYAELGKRFNWGKSRWATDWSWCQAMRYIANPPYPEDPERPILFLFDDMRLEYLFFTLQDVVKFLMERPSPFYALQLFCYSWPWDPEPDNYWLDGFVQEGFGGRGDYGLVLMPEGARRLLELHFEEPFDSVNNDLAILSRPGTRKTGFYSVRKSIVNTTTWDFPDDREPVSEKPVYDWSEWFDVGAER